MYCIKCGGMVHWEALSCFHCGTTINHNGNMQTANWDDGEAGKVNPKRNIQFIGKKIPVSHFIQIAIWASLIVPALVMPYIFKLSFEKYRNTDSILLDAALSMIVFFIFYFTKKALYNPKRK